MSTTPRYGDGDNKLLFRIVLKLSNDNGGAFAPCFGDSNNTLYFKLANLIFTFGL